jgi:hypothetical protein
MVRVIPYVHFTSLKEVVVSKRFSNAKWIPLYSAMACTDKQRRPEPMSGNDLYTPDDRDRARPYDRDRERDRDYDRLRDRERERDMRDRDMQRERERERERERGWHGRPPASGPRPPWDGRPVVERMGSARR